MLKAIVPYLVMLRWPMWTTGFVCGILFTIILAIYFGATPGAMRNSMRQSALQAGAGRWALDTNTWPATARFEWVTPDKSPAKSTNTVTITAVSTNKP